MWSSKCSRPLITTLKNRSSCQYFYPQIVDCIKPAFAACASYPFSTSAEEPKEIFVREKIQLSKSTIKKVKRQPFVKNLFCGIIDTDLLAFPEILSKQQVKEIEQSVQIINEIYKTKVDSHKISIEGKIPEEILSEFKELGLFGRLLPSEYGGLNLSHTALIRLNEATGLDWSLFATLGAHEFLAAQALLVAGSEQQKAKYLPDMASGKCVGALCWAEPISGSDLNAIQSTAYTAADGTSFSLNGTKHWVTNGQIADVFIVFVKMPKIRDEKEESTSVLLVDRNSKGITVSTENNNSGLRGAGSCTVQFVNVEVPLENLIGLTGDGAKILLKVLETCHLGMASFTFGTLKELLGHATEHVINTVRFEKPMTALPLIRTKLAKIATTIYAMESSAYFTAGLLDSTEDPDCGLECAVVKVLNSEGTLFCLREMMRIFGCSSFLKGHILERYYRDAEALESFEGTNDMGRLFISLLGLHYVGQKKKEFIMKNRNPFFFPFVAFKQMWRVGRVKSGYMPYSQDVAGHLHPSLVFQGNRLEECTQKLEVLVEYVFLRHGKDVVYHQLDPMVLADIAIDLYTMTAVLSRASRSYCIGQQNADEEIRMAIAVCVDAYARFQLHYSRLTRGIYDNTNEHLLRVAEKLIDWRGYYAEHPLKYNF